MQSDGEATNAEPVCSEPKCPVQSAPPSKSRPACGFVCDDPQLPIREIAFYLVALLSIITYAGYGFYLTYGVDMTKNLSADTLKPGWMREYKDVTVDSLFESASTNWKKLITASIGFLIVSKSTLAWMPLDVHHIVCSAYTLVLISLAVSVETAVGLLIVYAAFLCLAYFSFTAVWIAAGGLLYGFNVMGFAAAMVHVLKLTEVSAHTFAAIYGYLLCRLISLGHSMQTELRGQARAPGFWQYLRKNLPPTLHYAFYMPYMWCGPILTYDMFVQRLASRGSRVAIGRDAATLVAWRACRMLLWYYVLELIYHNLPVGSYLLTLEPDRPIVYKHLAFAMFAQGQNFMLAYVQYYGWPAALALLDGVQLLHWPNCISWVYSYSIMWRVFDRGLFAVMQAHLYIPLGGSKHGPLRQALSMVASFAFICVFHGDTANVRVWVTLNVAQLLTERAVASVYRNWLRSVVTKHLSPQNEKRLVGYIIAWNMMASCGIIFFFLGGNNGFIIFPEFLLLRSISRHTPVWHMLTMQFAAYCAVQIGRYYEMKIKPPVTRKCAME